MTPSPFYRSSKREWGAWERSASQTPWGYTLCTPLFRISLCIARAPLQATPASCWEKWPAWLLCPAQTHHDRHAHLDKINCTPMKKKNNKTQTKNTPQIFLSYWATLLPGRADFSSWDVLNVCRTKRLLEGRQTSGAITGKAWAWYKLAIGGVISMGKGSLIQCLSVHRGECHIWH